jgi:hypothetical protein
VANTCAVTGPRSVDRSRVEPLSAGRYRVQFTAGLELKGKLEFARNLMSHRNPTRDLAPIVESALDLLIEKLLKQRTGKRSRPAPTETRTEGDQPLTPSKNGLTAQATNTTPDATCATTSAAPDATCATTSAAPDATCATTSAAPDATCATTSAAPDANSATRASGPKVNQERDPTRVGSRRVKADARRAVVKRDGLRCAFVDAEGRRCEGRAFLEWDHRQPLGKGGSSDAENIRLLCRAHNRWCAEIEYGREKIAAEIERQDRKKENIDRR